MPLSKTAHRILGRLIFSIASGALLLLRIDYLFEKSDQMQYLLLPYREIYKDFLIGDWMTWQTSHYHLAYSWLIQGIHRISGEALFPWGVFCVHAIVLAGIGYGMLRLVQAANWHWTSAAIGVLLVGFVRPQGIAATLVNHGQLIPADISLVFLLVGCAAWIEDRYLRAGLCLGFSGLMHLNFAILAPLLLAGPELYRIVHLRRFREPLLLAGGFLILAWPTLLVTAIDLLRVDPAPGALDIVFKIRSPHHYNPPLATSVDLWWPVALLVAGLPVWIAGGAERMKGKALAFGAALLASQLLAGLATCFEWRLLIRIFLWRLSIPLILFAAMGAGENLVRAAWSRSLPRMLFAAGALPVLLAFSAKGSIRLWPHFELEGACLALPALLPLTLAALLLQRGVRWQRLVAGSLGAAALAWVCLVSLPGPVVRSDKAIAWRQAVDRWARFSDVTGWKIQSETRAVPIFWWIRNHTPKTAVFLIPPGETRFRLLARRSIFVDSKACPMIGAEVLEWQRRILAATGVEQLPITDHFQALTHQLDRWYNRRSLQDLATLARRERLTHILAANRKDGADAGLKKLFTSRGLAVYQVLDRPKAP